MTDGTTASMRREHRLSQKGSLFSFFKVESQSTTWSLLKFLLGIALIIKDKAAGMDPEIPMGVGWGAVVRKTKDFCWDKIFN